MYSHSLSTTQSLTLRLALLISLATATMLHAGFAETKLLRFPATNGTDVAFSYAGDLYTVPVAGGIARKLTNSPGIEVFPRFSSDGKQLAFTAQYDGNTEVYLMPSIGGEPKRLTYTAAIPRDDLSDRLGPNNIVMGWKSGSDEIVFRSRMHTGDSFNGELYTVTAAAALPQQLPVVRGGNVSFNADNSQMAYNRIFREFRTWKRYRGGMADDVWIFDFKSGEIKNITDDPASDLFPMWSGDSIYFSSDRDGRFNLFVYDTKGKATRQLTNFKEYDIKFPSLGGGMIAFENGGDIYLFDLKTEKARKVDITLAEDFAGARTAIVPVDKFIQSIEPAPDGARVAVVARGEVFSLPVKHGEPRNLSQTSGAHERNAVWSPDGKSIAYISDASGENELYVVPQDGSSPARKITSGADCYYYEIKWSPDSKKLLWADNKLRVRIVDVETNKVTEVVKGNSEEIRFYSWSPDSAWVAYARPNDALFWQVFLYCVADNSVVTVTDGWYQAYNPVFSPDGKYLYFVSDRDFKPSFGGVDFTFSYHDLSRIYLVTLAAATASPIAPKSDEVKLSDENKEKADKVTAKSDAGEVAKKDGKKDDEKSAEKVVVKVDKDGISQRIAALPTAPGSYDTIAPLDGKVFYLRYFGDAGDGFIPNEDLKRRICVYDYEKGAETVLGEADAFQLTHDGKKMLVKKDKTYSMIELPTDKLALEESISMAKLRVTLDRRAEWKQIFDESWRQMRDFFYQENMHGVDWKKEHARYAALLPSVRSRNDLTYIIGEMIAELNIGHAYVGGGERPERPNVQTGLLGAQFSKDKKTGYFEVTKVLPGENYHESLRSPLTEIGVSVKAGDFIIAINGKDLASVPNLFSELLDTPGKQVVLTVNTKAAKEGARTVTVIPVADEALLYYYNWVRNNIAIVDKATNGQVGYIHIPDMGEDGLNLFAKLFYPQVRKKALIVDVRDNGGGFVSPLIIERLRREAVFYDVGRNRGAVATDPNSMINGPMVCLINEFSASDGDIFPYRFRHHKLGKLIGKRTWGGIVGIRNTLPFVDGGALFKPEFTGYTVDGKVWPVEGIGVEPDIEVDNNPSKEFKGEDEQLARGIAEILADLTTKGVIQPPPPPAPDKSGIINPPKRVK
ncbi:MAG: S41 family peptidase [Verrucomicrobiota bacterium]|nr:S41 family peptidase [Verrucomicrobiota bacterium]